MTTIAQWPVVARDRIVHAFKPGGSSAAEGPFRTLRRHEWVSSGVRVSRRGDRGLVGQMTVFSSLNVLSARLARRGNASAAVRIASAAADLEAGPEFALLRDLLSDLSDQVAEQVVRGVLPGETPSVLEEAFRAVASRTEQVRASDVLLSLQVDIVFTGRIAEVGESHVILVEAKGATSIVPRWMASAAGRGHTGALLALVADKLDGASAVFEAVPAIEIEDVSETSGFTPFGRGDARTRSISADDARLLSGEPQPLRVLVPVTIAR